MATAACLVTHCHDSDAPHLLPTVEHTYVKLRGISKVHVGLPNFTANFEHTYFSAAMNNFELCACPSRVGQIS